MDTKAFDSLSVEETLERLNSSPAGISDEEAESRLKQYGFNEVVGKKQSVVLKFLSKFASTISIILYIVIVIAVYLGDYIDAYIIAGLVIFNGITSFLEEYKADNTVEQLKSKLAVIVKLKRSGEWKIVPAKMLVPGDIIRVRMGDIVPADAKIIESDYLSVDQSMLTGESLPVDKNIGEIAFSSSIVREGEATAVVISTGKSTAFGKTAELINTAKTKTHLESEIFKLLKYLMFLDAALIVGVLVGSYAFGMHLLSIVPFALLLLLTSVPVALPAAFTVAMAYGAQRLSSNNILITKLESIEEASTMNIVCLDKTGTITKNELSISDPIHAGSFSEDEVLMYGSMASREEDNDQIDLAIIKGAKKRGIKSSGYEQVSFKPFTPTTKISSAVLTLNGKRIEVAKGFPKVIIGMCGSSAGELDSIASNIKNLESRGFRTIAVAYKADVGWKLVGIIPLNDKPREDSKELIDELKSLNLQVKMLTGDNVDVARVIAEEVDIGSNILDLGALNGKNESEINDMIKNADGFAGVFPKDKYTVVKALQDSGFHVGMTGDGVNDAPALKQAEVGIAVLNSTDVAKSASDIVLTSDGIEPIVSAVKESRSIFERMVTYTIKKVSRVLNLSIFLSIAFLLLKFLPILPTQLVLSIFLSDIGSISLSTDNEQYSGRPDTWSIKSIFLVSLIFGVAALIEVSLLSYIALGYLGFNHGQFQTLVFLIFIVSMEITTLSMRERKSFWSSMPSKAVLLQIILSVSIVIVLAYYGILMTPISLAYILLTLGLTVVFLFFVDGMKLLVFKRFPTFMSI